MNRPTEFIVMKRLLYARKDLDPNLHGNQANSMIRQASVDALDGMDDRERDLVEYQAQLLVDKCHRMSYRCALELVAAVGDYLNGLENNGKKRT